MCKIPETRSRGYLNLGKFETIMCIFARRPFYVCGQKSTQLPKKSPEIKNKHLESKNASVWTFILHII